MYFIWEIAHFRLWKLKILFQQTFVSMKTSFVFVLKRSSRCLNQDENIRLTHTSSEDVFKTSTRRLDEDQIIILVIVFKTFSRRLQDIFKTYSGRFKDVLQRSLPDVFKTYHRVKLFLLTRFENDFEMYSERFWDILQRLLSTEGFA